LSTFYIYEIFIGFPGRFIGAPSSVHPQRDDIPRRYVKETGLGEPCRYPNDSPEWMECLRNRRRLYSVYRQVKGPTFVHRIQTACMKPVAVPQEIISSASYHFNRIGPPRSFNEITKNFNQVPESRVYSDLMQDLAGLAWSISLHCYSIIHPLLPLPCL
jgi:hypothetical protein